MTTIETLLLALLLIFTIPYLVWRLGKTEYYAPLVVVQIITGIVLGPGMLGAAYPEYFAVVFNEPVVHALSGLAAWAVMLFVWLAGIELDIEQAWRHRRECFVTAGLALSSPLFFGAIAAYALLMHSTQWMGAQAQSWQFIVAMGMACAVTALPILILFLEKLSILREPFGQRVLRFASLDDIAVWGVLAFVLMDWDRLGRQAAFLVAFVIATILIRKLFVRLAEKDRWFIGIIWLVICGFGSDWAGLHYMVGAFLSGMVLDHRWFNQLHLDTLRQNLLLIAMPVFFLITGLRTHWDMNGSIVFIAAGVLLLASVGGKLIGVHLAGKILKWPKGEASIIAWLLQTKALIMIIFANILLDRQIISGETFTALLLMAIASTMLTIPLVTPKLKRLIQGDEP